MNIKLNKKQLIDVYKAGYIPKYRFSLKDVIAEDYNQFMSLRQPWGGAWLISVRIENSHGKRRVYIEAVDPEIFNQYAAIKKIEELLNWK